MDGVKRKITNKDSLYYMAYVIFLSGSMLFGRSTLKTFLGISSFFWLKKVCYLICAVLIMMVYLLSGFFKNIDRKQFRQYSLIIALVGLFGLSWVKSGWGTYFMELMFLLSAKEIDLQRLPKVTMLVQCTVIPLIVCLALTGTIENIGFMYVRMDQEAVYRQALGFQHPNSLGAQLVQFCICWLWIRWEKWKWYDYFVYAICIYFLYTVCNSITSMTLIMLIAVINFLYRLLIKKGYESVIEKIMSICIWMVPLLCISMSFFYLETSALVTVIDHIVSWRFKIARDFLLDYPVSLLGSRLPQDAVSDIVYVDTIVRFGYIILILILFGMYRLMKYAIRKKMYPLVVSIFIYALYGVTEQCPYLLMYNFTLIYLSKIIYGKKENVFHVDSRVTNI